MSIEQKQPVKDGKRNYKWFLANDILNIARYHAGKELIDPYGGKAGRSKEYDLALKIYLDTKILRKRKIV